MTLESIAWIWALVVALFGLFIIILLGLAMALTIRTGIRMLREGKEGRNERS